MTRWVCLPCQVLWTGTDDECWCCTKPGLLATHKVLTTVSTNASMAGSHHHDPTATSAVVAGQVIDA